MVNVIELYESDSINSNLAFWIYESVVLSEMGFRIDLENDDFDYIIPMDSDGEDRPDEIKDLIKKIKPQSDLPIVCERVKRSEGFFFKFCYFLHKLTTFTFTGRSIRFGNFTCLPKEIVKIMTNEKATWSSFSGALSKISKL